MVASSRAPAVAVVAAAAAAAAIAYWLKIRQELSRKRNKRIGQGISKLARQIQELLETRKPRRIDGLQPEMYKLPPFIPKSTWTCLGDALRDCETLDVQEVPGERFITLRLDGSGFSKLTRRMTALGVFSGGYSAEFAEIMRECCQSLMTKFNAACGPARITLCGNMCVSTLMKPCCSLELDSRSGVGGCRWIHPVR